MITYEIREIGLLVCIRVRENCHFLQWASSIHPENDYSGRANV